MTEGTRLSRTEQKARTRLAIQGAALDLFEAQGYHKTTIDQIADAAEIGRRTFFRYFPSKEAVLFGDGRVSAFDGMLDALDAGLTAGKAPMKAMLDVLEAMPTPSAQPDEVAVRRRQMRTSLLKDPGVSTYYRSAFAELARDIAATIRRHPLAPHERFLPEVVGGLVSMMLVEHIDSGETIDFHTDPAPWREALLAATRGLD